MSYGIHTGASQRSRNPARLDDAHSWWGLLPLGSACSIELTVGDIHPKHVRAILQLDAHYRHCALHDPQAWLVDAETAAVDFFGPDPEGLLMAPVYAVPRLLDRNGLTLEDFDYYEIHEAFSGQVLCTLAAWEDERYCQRALGRPKAVGSIDLARLNVHGGSVGLGHPFAATGARILGAAAKQLAQHQRQTGRRGRTLVSICAAGGLGATAILESA